MITTPQNDILNRILAELKESQEEIVISIEQEKRDYYLQQSFHRGQHDITKRLIDRITDKIEGQDEVF